MISFSIGIALRQKQSSDVAGFLADADAAAYYAKAAGGNRAQLFQPSLRSRFGPERVLPHQIAEGIRRQEFILQYQPIVMSQSGKLVAVEALVRWKHPDGSLLQPISFIGAAERSGMMEQLGHEVLRRALEQRYLWTKEAYDLFLYL